MKAYERISTDTTQRETLSRFYSHLQRSLMRAYPNSTSDDVEEAIQHAMNQFCLSAPEHVRTSPPKLFRWLQTVASRALSQELRRRRNMVSSSREGEVHSMLIEQGGRGDQASRLACTSSVRSILARLSPKAARAVWLHDIENWKPSEIAEEMGCSINAVNHRVKRAHVVLRRFLRGDLDILLFGLIINMGL